MRYAIKKQMIMMAFQIGETLVYEVAVPMVKDFATNKVYPTVCEKWDEFVAKQDSKKHEKKVVKFNKRYA